MPGQPDHRASQLSSDGLHLSGQVTDRQRRLHGALRQLLQGLGQAKGHQAQRRRALEHDAPEPRHLLGHPLLPAARHGPGLIGRPSASVRSGQVASIASTATGLGSQPAAGPSAPVEAS